MYLMRLIGAFTVCAQLTIPFSMINMHSQCLKLGRDSQTSNLDFTLGNHIQGENIAGSSL